MAAGKKVYLAVIGVGGVGTSFLTQLSTLSKSHPSISLILLSRSSKSLTIPPPFTSSIDLSNWESALSSSTQPGLSPSETLTYLRQVPSSPRILIDNTSSQTLADAYPSFLEEGIHVITPNKKAFSGTPDLWTKILKASANPPAPYHATIGNGNPKGGLLYHESSVGAGLPTLSTLTMLLATGDRVRKIQGVFSGTLSFLFNTFAPVSADSAADQEEEKPKWSAVVKRAQSLGYTEPDPREDLNGLDVARKLVILARLCGMDVPSTSSFPVQSLIPKELESGGSGDEFLARLHEFDAEMEDVREKAEKDGKVVRFVASLDVEAKELKVGLEYLGKESPIVGLKGADNIFNYYTDWFGDRALTIQGPGAGGEITAMGVTGDLIKVMERIR
ncbi:hypothetical protein MMC25_006023 [Agyrium rufum]|nr:hypothetical protein [Agyrium rufum]